MRANRLGGAAFILVLLLSACASTSGGERSHKIRFDLDRLDENGLQGPPDGLRSLSYEFCIPDGRAELEEVQSIDPTLRVSRSPGRIGCTVGEVLCTGETHQSEFREVLERLASLDFVKAIEEAFFE